MNSGLLSIIIFYLAITAVKAANFCSPQKHLCFTSTSSSDGQTMTFKVTTSAAVGNGWAAVGLGSSMRNSDIMIMYPLQDGSNTVIVQDLWSTGHSKPGLQSQQVTSLQSAQQLSDGGWEFTVSRPVQALKTISNAEIDLIWAVGPAVSQSGGFQIHSNEGSLRANLFQQAQVSSSAINMDLVKKSHGALMFLSWGIAVPLAVFMARYMKTSAKVQWFRWHQSLAVVAILASLIAFILILATREFEGTAHGIFGIAVFVLMWFQAALGKYIDYRFNPVRTAVPWHDKSHWRFGWMLWIVSLVTMALGANYLSSGLLIAFIVFVIFMLAGFGYLEVTRGQTHHQNQISNTIQQTLPSKDSIEFKEIAMK